MIKISTDKAPKAIGPYSQAIKVNGMIYTSGQIPLDEVTGEVVGKCIEEQAEKVFENLSQILIAGKSSLDCIVKTTCFLADISDFAKFNEVYSKYIKNCPARSCVAVKTLPKNVLCEVEVIAIVKEY